MKTMMGTVADGFGLGDVDGTARVAGGLSHEMWRVSTPRGTFAVKVMRAHADAPDFRESIEAAFAIESRAFRAGVPCPEPIEASEGRALLRVGCLWVRAHRWCEGEVPHPPDHLEDAGSLLAQIHRVGGQSVRTLDDRPRDGRTWSALAERSELPAPLAGQLRSAAPELARLEAATAAGPRRATAFVDSHGDLDPKNSLVSSGRLLAVDWDAAGPRPIVREAVTLALDWSEDVDGFRSVLSAYTAASGITVPRDAWVLGGWVQALTGWLAFNLERRADTDLGRHEAAATSERLLSLHHSLDEYVSALATL